LILERLLIPINLTAVSTLVLNLDDHLKRQLDAMAAQDHKPLPDWAAEQLSRLAAKAESQTKAAYNGDWLSAFGSINDPTFVAPQRAMPTTVHPLDASL
jgi:hypothetical protein